jgi:hypothetical protein
MTSGRIAGLQDETVHSTDDEGRVTSEVVESLRIKFLRIPQTVALTATRSLSSTKN